jgi:hypothetical protein
MQLMFFLSGLFVWPSLQRKGWRGYLSHRLLRLGVPFLLGVYLLVPLALYAVYRATALDPSWPLFWRHWAELPSTPTGPMWFLWFLILLDVGAVMLYRLAPSGGLPFASLVVKAACYPGRLFIVLICVSAFAYLPLSIINPPWKWVGIGPFTVQATMAPQYLIYFLLGLAVGKNEIDRGLLDVNGVLAKHWKIWVAGSFISFLLWLIPTALIVKAPAAPVAILSFIGDLGVVVFAGAASFGMIGLCLRFANARWPIIDSISEYAYGIYFFHFLFVLWLQFALLNLPIPALVKGVTVLIAVLLLSWTASVATRRILTAHPSLGGQRRRCRSLDVG